MHGIKKAKYGSLFFSFHNALYNHKYKSAIAANWLERVQ